MTYVGDAVAVAAVVDPAERLRVRADGVVVAAVEQCVLGVLTLTPAEALAQQTDEVRATPLDLTSRTAVKVMHSCLLLVVCETTWEKHVKLSMILTSCRQIEMVSPLVVCSSVMPHLRSTYVKKTPRSLHTLLICQAAPNMSLHLYCRVCCITREYRHT